MTHPDGARLMVGSILPFIKGLYNVAPKCEFCKEIAQFRIIEDDRTERYLCAKCLEIFEIAERHKESLKMLGEYDGRDCE